MFSKTFLRTRCSAWNVRYFTCLLYELAALCWYNAMRIVAASWISFAMSKSFAMASVLAFSGSSIQSVGILISVGIMASIP